MFNLFTQLTVIYSTSKLDFTQIFQVAKKDIDNKT